MRLKIRIKTPSHHGWPRYLLFAVRCAAAASLAQTLAVGLGLSNPVWATLSALVVSQERLAETRKSLIGRLVGTLVGMGVAVVTHQIASLTLWQDHLQLLVAVAGSAVIARRWPIARACMWTAVIVLASPAESASIPQVALLRGIEVALGGLCGASAHYTTDWLLSWTMRMGRTSPARHP